MTLDPTLLRDAVAYAEQWVGFRQVHRRVPGIQLAVWHDGELLSSCAFGQADIEADVALTTEHIFRTASHSKSFTATAVMQLKEQGKLALDDPLARYIDWITTDTPQIADVTIRQVLSHSSGMIRDGSDGDFWQLEFDFPDEQAVREQLRDSARIFASNTQFKYSNIAFSMLGLVIAAASGSDYCTYVRDNIIRPLGLSSTGPAFDDRAAARVCRGYSPEMFGMKRFAFRNSDTRAMSAAAGSYSTASELCLYFAAHCFGDERLVSDASKREMQNQEWKVAGDDVSWYGLGTVIKKVGNRRLVGGTGGFPGYTTFSLLDPIERLVVVVLTNAIDAGAGLFAGGVWHIINKAMTLEPCKVPSPLDSFVGRYFDLFGAFDIARLGTRLFKLDSAADVPFGDEIVELAFTSPDTLRVDKGPGYWSPGETFTFDRLGDRVIRVRAEGAMSAYPIDEYERGIKARRLGEAD